MKIVREELLISSGSFAQSSEWIDARKRLHDAIKAVSWPAGSRLFTLPGKREKERRGQWREAN